MKKLLLSLVGVAAIASMARAGTVYERTTLENVVQSGEKFALFASGPIPNASGQYSLVWLTALTNGGSGTAAAIPYSGTYNPERFCEAMFAPVYSQRPALMALEAAGTATVSAQERDIYYLSYTNQSNMDVTSYVGITAGSGVFAVSSTKVTDNNGYKIYIEHAVNYWTAQDGTTVSSSTPYRISSVSRSGNAAMLHYQAGRSKYNFGATTLPAIPTTEDPQEVRYLDFYHTIPTVEQICGIGNEPSYSISLGVAQTIPAPTFVLKTIKENGIDVTPYVVDGNVSYKYEIEEGADILSIAADGTFTGTGEGTARVRVTLSDESAKFFDIEEPYYVNVTVSNFIPVTLTRVDNLASLTISDDVIFVSAKPFADGKGFVAARNDNPNSGVMYSASVLPGYKSLPADMTLSETELSDLRMFFMQSPTGSGKLGMRNTKVGGAYQIRAEKNYAIGYSSGGTNMSIIEASGGGYYPKHSSYSWYLGFFNGTPPEISTSVSYSTQVSQLTSLNDTTQIVPVYFYKINKANAQIETAGEVVLTEGETANVGALLKATTTNGELAEAPGAIFTYQVVNTSGAAFAQGQAPITVAADGTISVAQGKSGQARVKVTLSGDYSRHFNTADAYCDVIVRTPAFMYIGNEYLDMDVELFAGQSLTLPATTLKATAAGGEDLPGVAFNYILANDEYEPWYDAEGNPVLENELFRVDPATGVVTSKKGTEGVAYIVPVMTPDTEKYYVLDGSAQHFVYAVTVKAPQEATIDYVGGNDTAYITAGDGGTAVVPVPVVTVDGNAVENVSYVYTVIDPATGEPYAEGEAPVTVDPVTGAITPVEGKTGVAKIVVTLSDESALQYSVPAIEYVVTIAEATPTTATGPFVTEYVRVKEVSDFAPARYAIVSTRCTDNTLHWIYDFTLDGNRSDYVGRYGQANILTSTKLPEKIPASWLNPQACQIALEPAEAANKYYFSFLKNGKTYICGNSSWGNFNLYETLPAGNKDFTIAGKGFKEMDGNEGFVVNSMFTMMFNYASGDCFLSNSSAANVAKTSRAYPAFYRAVYEPTRITLAAGSHADLYKLVGTEPVKVQSLAEGENPVDLSVLTDATTFYIVPTDNHYLASVGFTDGTTATAGFEEVGTFGDCQKIVFGAAYSSYTVTTEERLPFNVTVGGSASTAVNLPTGTDGAVVPAPELLDGEGKAIEGDTFSFIYEVVDIEGNPFPAGEAPIAVDANGNITVLKPGHAFVKVSLTGEAAKRYDAQPATYEVNVTTPALIFVNDSFDDTTIDTTIGSTATLPIPALKVDGEDDNYTTIEGASFTFAICDSEGNPLTDEEGNYIIENEQVSIDPVTGAVTIKNGAEAGEVYIAAVLTGDLTKEYHTVDNYLYTINIAEPARKTFVRVNTRDELDVMGREGVLIVSTRQIGDLGYVAVEYKDLSDVASSVAEASNPANALTTLPSLALNVTELPAELSLKGVFDTNLMHFDVYNAYKKDANVNENDAYRIKVPDNRYLYRNYNNGNGLSLTETVETCNWRNSPFWYNVSVDNAGIFKFRTGNTYLGFNDEGALTHDKTAGMEGLAFYAPHVEATLTAPEGITDGVNINSGKSTKLPLPTLSGETARTLEGVTYAFTVVDADGNPIEDAAVSVDAEGNVTGIKDGTAHIMVTIAAPFDKFFDVEPLIYEVNVLEATPAVLGFEGGITTGSITVAEGITGETVPTPQLTTDDDTEITDVTFKYELIDPATGELFAEGEAPVSVDENGNITTIKPGQAIVKVSLSDEDALHYDAEPITYEVNVTKPTSVKGVNDETEINLPIGIGASADLPLPVLKTVENGEEVEVPGATFTYEVINPATGEAYADGQAPVIVDPATGKVTSTGNSGEAQIKVTANGQDAEPLYIDVTVKDYTYVKLQRIIDPSTIKADDPVVMVSSRPISGKGFVSAAADTESLGIETGTTGNMPPVSVLPGQSELPDELLLTDEQADALRMFSIVSKGNAFGFQMKNGVKFGTDQYIRSEKNDRIRYLNGQVIGYQMRSKSEGVFAPAFGNFYLNFNANGILTSFTSSLSNANGADIVFYSVFRPKAEIAFDNGATSGSVNIPSGKTGESVPTPVLTDENDEPIEGVTFTYTVIDPATGEPFAEGEAPITVDENGNITTVEGKTGDAQVVVTLSDESGALYDAEPAVYNVTVTSSTVITGANGEEVIDLQLGKGTSIELPAMKVETVDPETGEMVPVENVNYIYEVINPTTGEPFAEGEAPVSVDPETGKITSTGNSGDAQIKVIANGQDAEALYIGVTVKDYSYVKLQRITDPSTIKAGAPVVMVSSRPISGKGFVSAAANTESLGIETGTTGNMPPVSVLPGQSVLPDELLLTNEQADALRLFNIVSDGNAFGFQMKNGVKFGTNQYIRSEKNDRIRYLNGQVIGYQLTPKSEGVFAPAFGNFYLNFNANGILTSFTSSLSNANGADIVFYSVFRPKAEIAFDNGVASGSVNIPSGKTGESVPTPVLTDENDEPIEGVTFTYSVIDPATGEPFAEGEAPITVDENGNITTVEGKTGDAQVVVTLSDESGTLYDAEPAVYNVTVTSSTVITGANGEEVIDLQLGNGASIELPAMKVETVDPETGEMVPVENVKYIYEVINPATGEPFAEGEAPVTVDPETGKVTATDINGEAQIKVTVPGQDAEPMYIDVTVKDYTYIKLQRITDPSTIKAGDPVVMVSSRPISGKGFVSAAADTESLGIETGTTGNMPPVSVLPGQSELPDELLLTDEQANALRMFSIVSDGNAYGFQMKNGVKFGTNQYIRSERNDRIRYLGTQVTGYQLTPKSEGVFAPAFGNFYLSFNANGILTSFSSSTSNANGADIVFYSVIRPKAEIAFDNGATSGSVNIPSGKTGESVPTPVLTDENDEPIEGVTFTYSVINPATGEPFAEGEAPITVDENGNITTVEGKTGDAQVVVTLSDESGNLYDAEPAVYNVTVTSSTVITGANGEEEIDLQLGKGASIELPAMKVETVDPETGEMVPVENVNYIYEVINPATGEPFAKGEAPVTVDPETGKVTATDINGEAQIKVTVPGQDAEPMYIDVTVKDYTYIKLQRITDPSTIKAGDPVVMVSSRPISGKGFVSAAADTESLGIETGTTGNMPPVSVLPGQSVLPDELLLTNEQADALRMFSIVSDGTAYGFQMKNGVKFGTNQYIRSERNDRIRYLGTQVIGYQLTPKSEGVFAPAFGNFYLSFNANGILTSFSSSMSNANGADIVFYSVIRPKAEIAFDNGATSASVNIPSGKTGESVPTPVLTNENDEPIEGVTFTYSVIDPATGEPFAEGEAPITVDENGNITTVEGKTGDAQVVVNLSDESGNLYDAEPAVYNVTVTSSTFITTDDGDTEVKVANGSTIDLPVPVLKTIVDGEEVEVPDVTFTYEVIDPATGEAFAEGEAPVTVDPETGKVTAVKDGDAQIKVTITGELADEYTAEPLIIDVTVTEPAEMYVTYRKVNSVDELEQLAAENAGIIVVSARTFDDMGFVAATKVTDANNNFLPVSILNGETELPAEFTLSTGDADALLSVYAVKQGEHFGFRLPAGHYLKRTINNKIILTTAFHGYKVSDHKAAAKAKGRAAAAETNDGFRLMTNNNFLGFVANGNLSHQNNGNIFTNGAAPAFYTINKVKATATFENGTTTSEETLAKGESVTIPEVKLTTEQDGQTVTVDGVKYKYEVVDNEGNPIPAATSPITIDPETGEITAVKGGDARVKITPADNAEMIYDAEPVYVDITVPSTDEKLVVDGKDTGSITVSDDDTEPVTVPWPTLVDADNQPIDAGLLTYGYEVVDANGNPFPEGQAPITINDEGQITVKPGSEGQAYVRVSLTGDAAQEYPSAEPYVYEVIVERSTTGPVITIGDDDERTILIDNGTASASIPTPELTVDGIREADATFTYTVVDEQGKPFAEGEAPIAVDPDSGDIIVIKPGIAQIIVSLSEESAEHLGVEPEPVTIDVQVLDKQTSIIDVEAAKADDAIYFNLNGVQVESPVAGHYIRVRGNKAEKVLVK